MKLKQHLTGFVFLAALCTASVTAQEALVSDTEQYYDFLALQGLTKRPYLNYRTLSDSDWAIEEGAVHPWQEKNLGTKRNLFDKVFMRVYGPELFTSYNTAAPYGQNDGALWQGKGFNTSLTGGIRFEAYGIELTYKPQLSFSQNAAFDLIPREMSGANYAGKAAEYGYFWSTVDAPQRFGDTSFFTYDWGDSEIRYTWKTLTMGFGTEAIWLGSAYLNPILHSNNAPSYPKFDIGLRRQPITIPRVNWYLGDVEVRLWAGFLSESDYFDIDNSNNHNLISGLAFAYAPSFLPGLTLFANRVYTSKWSKESLGTIKSLLLFQFNSVGGDDIWDQRISIGYNYLLPKAGIEIYSELGFNDNPAPDLDGYVRNFSHTMVFLGGLKKFVKIDKANNFRGELIFEYNNMEMSAFYSQFLWANNFYMHHQITQGYTNKGQWLGAGLGTGGNSQFLGFNVYYPKGNSMLYLYRYNVDNDYLLRYTTPNAPPNPYNLAFMQKTVLGVGIKSLYFFMNPFHMYVNLTYLHLFDYVLAGQTSDPSSGFHIELGAKINF